MSILLKRTKKMARRRIRLLRGKNEVTPKFKVGDVIRRKPLESYNYEQPVMKIVAIKKNLYVFEKKPLALEIAFQDEWELYDTFWRKLWRGIKNFFCWPLRYRKRRFPVIKHVGQQKEHKGLTLFMYNKVTGEICQAPVINHSVIMEKDCIYRQALNEKNFIKKLKKEGWIE